MKQTFEFGGGYNSLEFLVNEVPIWGVSPSLSEGRRHFLVVLQCTEYLPTDM